MHIEITPSPLPGETIYSLIGCILALNGIRNDDANKVLFDSEDEIRLADGKIDLDHFASVARGRYGNADDIAAAFTNIRFFQQLGTPRSESTLANLSNGEAHIWRWCPSCLRADQKRFGVPYWHRTHQLPGTYVCVLHKIELVEANAPYRDRQSHVLHPGYLPASMNSTAYSLEADARKLAHQLGRFAEDALHDDSPAFPWCTSRQAMLDGLRKWGLASARSHLRLEAIARNFSAFYMPLGTIPEISSALKEKNIERISRLLRNEGEETPQIRDALLLAFWLFREWETFKNACSWADVMGASPVHTQKGPHWGSSSEPEIRHASPQQQHREVCMGFLQEHPYANRSQFWRAHPKSCRWLNRNDATWFTDIFHSDICFGNSQLKLI